jgi:hypothetical protein
MAAAARLGWQYRWLAQDTIGGEHAGIVVVNAHGRVLARSSLVRNASLGLQHDEAKDHNWEAERRNVTRKAFMSEQRREARRVRTRLRRASAALIGRVDLEVVIDPAHQPRPPRDRDLEASLREHRGLARRQARDLARQLQARGTSGSWTDGDVDAVGQPSA